MLQPSEVIIVNSYIRGTGDLLRLYVHFIYDFAGCRRMRVARPVSKCSLAKTIPNLVTEAWHVT
jgi:hypothetical protein